MEKEERKRLLHQQRQTRYRSGKTQILIQTTTLERLKTWIGHRQQEKGNTIKNNSSAVDALLDLDIAYRNWAGIPDETLDTESNTFARLEEEIGVDSESLDDVECGDWEDETEPIFDFNVMTADMDDDETIEKEEAKTENKTRQYKRGIVLVHYQMLLWFLLHLHCTCGAPLNEHVKEKSSKGVLYWEFTCKNNWCPYYVNPWKWSTSTHSNTQEPTLPLIVCSAFMLCGMRFTSHLQALGKVLCWPSISKNVWRSIQKQSIIPHVHKYWKEQVPIWIEKVPSEVKIMLFNLFY